MTTPKVDYTGKIVGPWLAVERYRTATDRKLGFRCLHLELDRVVGIAVSRMNWHVRQGAMVIAPDEELYAAARLKVDQDNALRARCEP